MPCLMYEGIIINLKMVSHIELDGYTIQFFFSGKEEPIKITFSLSSAAEIEFNEIFNVLKEIS